MLTIIIPVFNEKKYLRLLLSKVIGLKHIKTQIIVVDDGSTDGSTEILRNEFLKKKKINRIVFHKHNSGKGSAIKSAQKFIKGKFVAIQDADLEYDPKDLVKIYKKMIKNNYRVIYGSRVLNKNIYQNTKNFTHLIRIWGNIFLTKVSNLINNQNLTDAHTCYKLFKSQIFKNISLKEKDFSFCPEITTKLSLKKISIKEIPINYQGRTYSEGKKIVATDGFKAIKTLIKYRFFSHD